MTKPILVLKKTSLPQSNMRNLNPRRTLSLKVFRIGTTKDMKELLDSITSKSDQIARCSEEELQRENFDAWIRQSSRWESVRDMLARLH